MYDNVLVTFLIKRNIFFKHVKSAFCSVFSDLFGNAACKIRTIRIKEALQIFD